MPLFSRNKPPVEDDWGEKDLPYRTSERSLDDYGVYPVRGRTRKSMTVQKFIVRLLIISLVSFVAFSLFSSLRSNSAINQTRAAVAAQETPAFKVRYSSLGEEVIRAYYGHQMPVSNLLPGVVWPGSNASNETAAVDVSGLQLIRGRTVLGAIPAEVIAEDDTQTFKNPLNEVLEYTGVIDGRQYSFTVNLIIPDVNDYTKLPYLAAAPVIEPMEPLVTTDFQASRPDTSGENPEYVETTLNDSSISRISSWASAYAQGDGEALKMIAGDGNINAFYEGVGGYSLVGTPNVQWSYEKKDQDNPNAEGTIYARIDFQMETTVNTSSGSAASQVRGTEENRSFRPIQTFDILLANYDEGVPNIVAWTPGGGWYELEKYMNAIISEKSPDEIEVINPDNPEDPQQATPTSTSGGRAPGAPDLDDEETTTSRSNQGTGNNNSSRTSSRSESPRSSRPTSSQINRDNDGTREGNRTSSPRSTTSAGR